MAETIIDPVQAGKPQTGAGQTGAAQAGAGLARSPVESGPITADLGTIVTRAARRFGAKTALIAPGRTLTYSELDDLCDRVAGGLHDIGVRPGDRISLYSPNRWEWVIAYHAALRAGAVVNPVNVMLTAEEVAFVLNDCGAAAIFTSGGSAAWAGRPCRRPRWPNGSAGPALPCSSCGE
jgi:non-ribosomal peptide synthetase component E (peptide arylation enzyme)